MRNVAFDSLAVPETLRGVVERVTYYSPDSGYSVLRLRPEIALKGRRLLDDKLDDDGLATVVGIMTEFQPGETLEFSGQWTSHPDYGPQFKAETVTPIMPTTQEGIRRYLGSGMIKGIGPRTADRIVNFFGDDTLEILDTTPERLSEVPGIRPAVINQINEAWATQRTIREVMVFLQGHGITTGLAVKIFKVYGAESIAKVQEDPYRLAREITGIGFLTADKIARNIGMPNDSAERLAAGVLHALEDFASDGNVYAPRAPLISRAAELLQADPQAIESELPGLQADKAVLIEEIGQRANPDLIHEAVYLPPMYYSEVGAAKRLRAMINDPASALQQSARGLDWKAFFADLKANEQIQLTDQQQDAVQALVTHKISVLTGGPGTGKTTTTRAIIKLFEKAGISYSLASPTGRAAKRLGEATGRMAQTIHRLLSYSPKNGFGYNESHPLDAQAVVIDEASMLDLSLFYNLLKALKPETHLLLVGDVDQLPSVGAGDVLRDVIASGAAHVTRLEVIFRQSAHSLIVANAHRINHGQLPEISNDLDSDFFLFRQDDPEAATEMVIDLVTNRIPRQFGFKPESDIQVLAPMYRGSAGVQALNIALQRALNPSGRRAEKKMFGATYRVGDRVMQTRNDYDKDVYNGDIGKIESFDPVDETMSVLFDDRYVEYEWSEADSLTHAFCISTHKSQGAEYPVIVMPILNQHYVMLQRNLLYTAITRARKLVVLVGSQRALSIAVANDQVAERFSGLSARLR